MRHEITIKDLGEWEVRSDTLARSFRTKHRKELIVDYIIGKTDVTFEVLEEGEIVYTTDNIEEAIHFYNKVD